MVLQWYRMLWWCSGIDMQCYGGAVVQNVVVVQWYRHAMLWCCSGIDMQCYGVAVV